MQAYISKTLTVAVAVLFCLAAIAMAAEEARIVSIAGESTTYHLQDMGGKSVTVEVPSTSPEDIKIPSTAPQSAGAAAPSTAGRVDAQVVSVNAENNQVRVRTQTGQEIVLEMSPASLATVQPGTPLTLVVPQ